MKKAILERIDFPNGIEFDIIEGDIVIRKGEKEIVKSIKGKNIEVRKEENSLILESKKATKREKKIIMTIKAHINNIIKGLNEGYVYKLEIAYLHFPITVEVQKDKGIILIKNFLGEKKPRISEIIPGAEVSVEKNIITVKSYDKEIAGQTAANIERATKIRNRDRRKFQDGIYIIEKAGRAI
ncbi:MAG: 50S ribosomal protein L6 [Candidatus Pacearchaeota archaeon]